MAGGNFSPIIRITNLFLTGDFTDPSAMEPPKEFNKVTISLENSIIPDEALENTPSRRDGIPESLEMDLRVVGCEYIQSAGLLLKLPQVRKAGSELR